METAVDPNVDTSPNLESAMDAFLSSDSPSATDEPSASGTETQETSAEGGQDPNAQAEGQDDQQAQTEERAEDAPSDVPEDDDQLDNFDPAGKKVIRVDAGRFARIHQGYKYQRELRDIAPDVQTARMHYQRANDLLDMKADLASGDPQAVDRFLGFWKNESPQAFGTLVNRALESAPAEVRDQLRTSAVASTIDEAYQQAAQSGDPQELYRAQMLDWSVTGKYRAKDALPKPVDPLARREAEVQRREQSLQQAAEQRVNATVTRVDGQVQNAMAQQLTGEVDKLLAPVKGRFAKAPELFEALRDRITSKVKAELAKDQEWNQNHSRDVRLARQAFVAAVRQNQQFDVRGRFQPLVDEYGNRARNVVAPIAKKLVNEATATLVADNQARHDKLSASSSRREPAGGGAPTRKNLMPNIPQGASLDEKMDTFFRS